MILVWNWRAIGESSRTRWSCRDSEPPVGTDFNQNSKIYTVLKFPLNNFVIFSSRGGGDFWSRENAFTKIDEVVNNFDALSVHKDDRIHEASAWYGLIDNKIFIHIYILAEKLDREAVHKV